VRHAAQARALPYTATAGTEQSLPIDMDAADIVLLGPHMAHLREQAERAAAARSIPIVLLPADVFLDFDGIHTLALVTAALPAEPAELAGPAEPAAPHQATKTQAAKPRHGAPRQPAEPCEPTKPRHTAAPCEPAEPCATTAPRPPIDSPDPAVPAATKEQSK